MTLNLVKNPDIIASVAKLQDKPFTVGFAAETQNILEYAKNKLINKNLDLIAANNVSDQNIGFNSDDNALTLISAKQTLTLSQARKSVLATQLIEHIADLLASN